MDFLAPPKAHSTVQKSLFRKTEKPVSYRDKDPSANHGETYCKKAGIPTRHREVARA